MCSHTPHAVDVLSTTYMVFSPSLPIGFVFVVLI